MDSLITDSKSMHVVSFIRHLGDSFTVVRNTNYAVVVEASAIPEGYTPIALNLAYETISEVNPIMYTTPFKYDSENQNYRFTFFNIRTNNDSTISADIVITAIKTGCEVVS